jgi:flavin reductase (DIM6/NTAB) family NADH-FMN oxidoreductase RutF
MSKTTFGPQTLLYPMPALIIGANVDGKPNFMTAAWAGIANAEPPMISVAIRQVRHTLKGIRQNMTFSVNMPSTDMVTETDYCGITPGIQADKAKDCNFEVFYGKLETVPLVEQCPVNLECKVEHMLELGSHILVIGKIEETYVSDSCLTGGRPDVSKIKPLVFTMSPASQYQSLGEVIGKAFSIGKELRAKK